VELLAVRAPLPVSESELIGALWGDNPPVTATKTLQSVVSRVRRTLPALSIGPPGIRAAGTERG
jgi:DNA-binding SARP family transcriptional activator